MNNELIPIRLSHLLGQNGVGAIVRGTSGLVVVQDIRNWTDRDGEPGEELPYVERVRASLGIEELLRRPLIAKENSQGQIEGVCVPATTFPTWYRCSGCGKLHQRSKLKEDTNYVLRCKSCEYPSELEQVSWVQVTEDGYLSDVNWHSLIHFRQEDPKIAACKIYGNYSLKVPGNGKRELVCNSCFAREDFKGNEQLPFYGRVQPWLWRDVGSEITGDTSATLAHVVAVNDTRVYSPVFETALVIPPESRIRKGTVVDRLYRSSSNRKRIDGARNSLARKSAVRQIATKYRCSVDELEQALKDLKSGYPLYGEHLSPGLLPESEYEAFLEIMADQREDEDLATKNLSDQWRTYISSEQLNARQTRVAMGIKDLVRVDRLKAIHVFRSFTRMGGKTRVPPNIVGKTEWLPAMELYGEGIFLTLDEERLLQWESHTQVNKRLDGMLGRFVESGNDKPNPLTSRFLLLHTLSHLLMREIESEGGYPAASLQERIYSSSSPKAMAGLLIHVAVPDIAGSLGGLAELSEPDRFMGILNRAIEHAHWCSFDPVCSEHEGQGPGMLNRAACHGCALVPDPACDYGNTLLDRVFVKGSSHGEGQFPSFFEDF